MALVAATLICLVVGIPDGDTLSVRCDAQAEQPAQTLKVRLTEIDAPAKGQAFGNRSKQYLSAVCFQKPAEIRPPRLNQRLQHALAPRVNG